MYYCCNNVRSNDLQSTIHFPISFFDNFVKQLAMTVSPQCERE